MSDFQPILRSSVERGDREKSQSDERSISHGVSGGGGGQWGSAANKGKAVTVEVEPPANSTLSPQVLADLAALGYQMRPAFHERFSAEAVRVTIKAFLEEFFATRKTYDFSEAEDWVEVVSKECVARVKKDMSNSSGRYKFVGHVVLGEHIGGGFHSGMKCCWDADSDMYATYTYLGDNLFCVVTICGIYTY